MQSFVTPACVSGETMGYKKKRSHLWKRNRLVSLREEQVGVPLCRWEIVEADGMRTVPWVTNKIQCMRWTRMVVAMMTQISGSLRVILHISTQSTVRTWSVRTNNIGFYLRIVTFARGRYFPCQPRYELRVDSWIGESGNIGNRDQI